MLRVSISNLSLKTRVRNLLNKFDKSSSSSSSTSNDTHQDIDQGNLKPDIYTTPDPRVAKVQRINWLEVQGYAKARRFLAYPSLPLLFNPLVAMDGNTRKLDYNRPERWGNRIIKDKVIYQFREREDIDCWHTSTDHMMNGFSWSELTQSTNKKTICFRGFLNNKMPTDRLPLPGQPYIAYAYMQTNPWTDGSLNGLLNWQAFDKVILRVRGDGRQYKFCMWSDKQVGAWGGHQFRMHKAPFQTNGGPQWQEIHIPFGKFLAYEQHQFQAGRHNEWSLTSFKRKQISNIQFLRIELHDKNDGPFQLEIDTIAVAKDKKEQLLDNRLGYDQWFEDDYAMKNYAFISNAHFSPRGTPISRFDDKMAYQKRMTSNIAPMGRVTDYKHDIR